MPPANGGALEDTLAGLRGSAAHRQAGSEFGFVHVCPRKWGYCTLPKKKRNMYKHRNCGDPNLTEAPLFLLQKSRLFVDDVDEFPRRVDGNQSIGMIFSRWDGNPEMMLTGITASDFKGSEMVRSNQKEFKLTSRSGLKWICLY